MALGQAALGQAGGLGAGGLRWAFGAIGSRCSVAFCTIVRTRCCRML
ncbi:hypothetical protein COLINT_03486 [Collinsella intestinalis DSM 13280]|uniref:Uncharacterized protein n=1 Tax=Collinsella intestinalis DSM 13280 TaxID=521003 RepID=C4FBM4_9ACTN|nr:hypothetical protein COLINT_03486 [Collinsella intestinalis DSM 13280]